MSAPAYSRAAREPVSVPPYRVVPGLVIPKTLANVWLQQDRWIDHCAQCWSLLEMARTDREVEERERTNLIRYGGEAVNGD